MNHHVEAKFERTLNPGTGKGVVGDRNRLVLARQLRDRSQIDQLEQRIAWRLHPNHARVGLKRLLHLRRIAHVDEGEVQIGGAAADFFEKPISAAIKVIAYEDMRTAVDRLKRGGHRSEPGGERPTARATLQISYTTFVGAPGGIDRARIVITFVPTGTFLCVG